MKNPLSWDEKLIFAILMCEDYPLILTENNNTCQRKEQSIQSLMKEICLLKASHNSMKFLSYLRLKNTPYYSHLCGRKYYPINC
jgi:hypothetical protein